jgi:4-diphosphocytidyl-2-C-methyl-D-erythritol kinase
MIFFPNAKINLGLRITGKRPDGYHNIETIFYPVGLSDALEFVLSDRTSNKDILKVTGIDTGSKPDDNLVIKAVMKLREKNSFPPLRIHLHKAIPVGAGLGGGSSDAACLLKVLNRQFELNIDKTRLKELALELGSDCPFFIDCVPSAATGRGEIMTPVKPALSGYYLVILNPGVGLSTAEAYAHCRPEVSSTSLLESVEYPINEWRELIINDFEAYAFQKHPIIGELKKDLYKYNALFSLMSGSGSSVFGVFLKRPTLPQRLAEYIIWEGMM